MGDKIIALINRWEKEGIVCSQHKDSGMFQTDGLPEQCSIELRKVFSTSTKTAVEKANKQIKETKKYFGLPDAKGLLILANDGNYSIHPMLMMQILANLLKSSYKSIDSFIFFTPNMRAYTPQIDRQLHVWISGPAPLSSNIVEPEFLNRIQQGWCSFIERKFGEPVTQFHIEEHGLINDIKFVK